MPQLLTRLARQLASRHVKNAVGVAKSLLVKRGQMSSDGKLTSKGKKRQSLGNDGRAIDRAAKKSGRKASAYKYNSKTNRAILKK